MSYRQPVRQLRLTLLSTCIRHAIVAMYGSVPPWLS